MSTDGRWCYIVLWVVARPGRAMAMRWDLLKDRLIQLCPVAAPFGLDNHHLAAAGLHLHDHDAPAPSPNIFLLKFFCYDRMGLLHGGVLTTFSFLFISLPHGFPFTFLSPNLTTQ
jgi:hypothetical protein